jgi:hypothetical protein
MTTETMSPWTTWADFNDDGEPTGHTIIGDPAGRAVFCTVDATPGEIALAVRLREMRDLLAEAARLMPVDSTGQKRWQARTAALLAAAAR